MSSRSKNREITEEELMDYVSKLVVHYKRIMELKFIQDAELPRSPIGKILKRVLRDQELQRMKEAG
jgi:acyl-CoA synthetase (AMP-forming)/AMP-acid ligase II